MSTLLQALLPIIERGLRHQQGHECDALVALRAVKQSLEARAKASARWSDEEIDKIALEQRPVLSDMIGGIDVNESQREVYAEALRYARDHALLSGEGMPDFKNMPIEQVEEFLRSEGIDPDEEREHGRKVIADIREKMGLKWKSGDRCMCRAGNGTMKSGTISPDSVGLGWKVSFDDGDYVLTTSADLFPATPPIPMSEQTVLPPQGTVIHGIITGANNGQGFELGKGSGYCDFWEGTSRKFGTGQSPATLILGNGISEETVRMMLEEMTPDERVEYFESLSERYCFWCGSEQLKIGRCQCHNDE